MCPGCLPEGESDTGIGTLQRFLVTINGLPGYTLCRFLVTNWILYDIVTAVLQRYGDGPLKSPWQEGHFLYIKPSDMKLENKRYIDREVSKSRHVAFKKFNTAN